MKHLPYMELSKQEYVVAELLTRGKTEKEIACELFISPKTVNNHKTNIRKKWDARNAVDIARKFILSLDDPKQFFAAMVFLTLQFYITFTSPDMDLRRPTRTSVRVNRTLRKNRE